MFKKNNKKQCSEDIREDCEEKKKYSLYVRRAYTVFPKSIKYLNQLYQNHIHSSQIYFAAFKARDKM